jgi:hypothetical protein
MEACLDQSLHGAQARVRVLVLGMGVILLFLSSVGLFLYLKPGSSTPTDEELPVFVAGPIEGFELGTVSYFEIEHVYVVRMMNEALLALYDLSPGGQALVHKGDMDALDKCRVEWVEDENGWTSLGTPPPGFEDMVFREPCLGNIWDAAGRHLVGPTEGDLDQFPLTVTEGIVRVDVNGRICLNQVSSDAPCIPTE